MHVAHENGGTFQLNNPNAELVPSSTVSDTEYGRSVAGNERQNYGKQSSRRPSFI